MTSIIIKSVSYLAIILKLRRMLDTCILHQTFLLESIIHDTLPSASISRYYKYIPETEKIQLLVKCIIFYT